MNFKTKISKTKDGNHTIYGHDLLDLIEKKSFSEVIFLLWRENFPTNEEKELLEAVLVASVENGIEAPSVFVPRVSVSAGNSMHTALATGILSIGENHGGAAEKCAELLKSGLKAGEIVEKNKIIAGFGHKIYKDKDPRAEAIYQKAKKLGFPCEFFDLAYEIESELEKKAGKKIPLNIDGAIAAVMLELKIDPSFGKALFALARLVGASAHVKEEMEQKNSYHRLEESDVENL